DKPIPRKLFEMSSTWATEQCANEFLIKDYTTIKAYFQQHHGQVVISKEMFMKEFSKGIFNNPKKVEDYFDELDLNNNGIIDDNDLKQIKKDLAAASNWGKALEQGWKITSPNKDDQLPHDEAGPMAEMG
ncbi:hypothetical protein IWQ61_010490, partial [Dispira simplex]